MEEKHERKHGKLEEKKEKMAKKMKGGVMSNKEYDKKYFAGSSKLRKAYGPRI